jgi:hypothetical protein
MVDGSSAKVGVAPGLVSLGGRKVSAAEISAGRHVGIRIEESAGRAGDALPDRLLRESPPLDRRDLALPPAAQSPRHQDEEAPDDAARPLA